jgi:hypothetical protein
VAECTKLGGYFIGTCFDGARIFQALARLESGDEVTVLRKGYSSSGSDPEKMWSVRKKYHQTEFEPDSSSIGYEIEVYQDTINKATKEYLVNFDYLTQLLENYGFDLVTPEEAETTLSFPMPDGTATFETMFHHMEAEYRGSGSGSGSGSIGTAAGEYGSAMYMTAEEKQVSFYNRYFIFRKNRNINAKQLKNSFLSYAGLQEEQDRAVSAGEEKKKGEDELAAEKLALEKIARASRPIDVATKPAIAAHILAEAAETATSATLKIKPKPKPRVKTVKAAEAAVAVAVATEAVQEPPEAPSAPIAQIEKKIQKRTKKVAAKADAPAPAPADAPAPAAPARARKTKKKTDL